MVSDNKSSAYHFLLVWLPLWQIESQENPEKSKMEERKKKSNCFLHELKLNPNKTLSILRTKVIYSFRLKEDSEIGLDFFHSYILTLISDYIQIPTNPEYFIYKKSVLEIVTSQRWKSRSKKKSGLKRSELNSMYLVACTIS